MLKNIPFKALMRFFDSSLFDRRLQLRLNLTVMANRPQKNPHCLKPCNYDCLKNCKQHFLNLLSTHSATALNPT